MKEVNIKPIIGMSACVHGEKVRYDTGHKRSDFCMNELSKHVSFKTFCPEVAIGLPIPRPTIRQVQHENIIKVSQPDGTGDVTEALTSYGQKAAKTMSELSGFIFCQKSPSCGMERVKVWYDHGKGCKHDGVGVFAREVMAANPLLPCEENGRLNDMPLRENFIIRVFTYRHWQELVASGLTKHKLTTFHSEHKYLVMSHNVQSYKALGQLLAKTDIDLQDQADEYIAGLMTALKKLSNRKSHTNTLLHLQGYFKKYLSKQQKEELVEKIEDYRLGMLPLLVPLTLINHYLREHTSDYLSSQVYLSPYPDDLKLRYGF
jgi:uncharacterized protein YbgA (DUF1722 family)/uncharacterized protein YbbK (DUF523 family)